MSWIKRTNLQHRTPNGPMRYHRPSAKAPASSTSPALVETDPSVPPMPPQTTPINRPPRQTQGSSGSTFRSKPGGKATGQNRLFSHWESTVPQPNEKKKIFVDDAVLMNLLVRLADTDQPQRLAFRFVLALILMRKKLLRYEGAQKRPDTSRPTSGMVDGNTQTRVRR